jgi:hypothetical protein
LTDQVKEQIRFNTEVIRLIAIFLLATGGGVVALIIGGVDSGRKIFFVTGGLLTIFACIIGFYRTYTETQKLLRQ